MSLSSSLVGVHQRQLLDAVHGFFVLHGKSLSDPVRAAFMAAPRHLFVKRYKTFGASRWQELEHETSEEHLAVLYRDNGLAIFQDAERLATISRPAFALFMLELLEVGPGGRVLEIGSGSGWNAALLGRLVGDHGSVDTVEIIPELAAHATRSLARAGVANVRVHLTDGGRIGSEMFEASSFDRVVFTTAAHDLPSGVTRLLKQHGIMLFILKCPGGGDVLIKFCRNGDVLTALEARLCEFVSMSGLGRRQEHEPIVLSDYLKSIGLSDKITLTMPFSCGGRHAHDFVQRTFPLRSFLAATQPNFITFTDPIVEHAFGIASDSRDWLLVVQDGEARSYGTKSGWDYLMECLQDWVKFGLPTMLSMDLRAYPSGRAPSVYVPRQWLMRRREADFVWSL